MLALLLFGITVTADFEAGSTGKVEWLSGNHMRCTVAGEADQNRRNAQPSWFYFRLDGVAGRDLTIDLTGFGGEYDLKPDPGDWARTMRPFYSYDDRTWHAFKTSAWAPETRTIRVRIKPRADRVWISRLAPYTNQHLETLMRELRGHPHLQEAVVGKTVEGRPMRLLTITNPGIADAKKKVIWLMARQHAWEADTSWVAEGALRFLLSKDPRAARIRNESIFKVFPMADPDGVFRGGVRFNNHGYDLNRNWNVTDVRLMPEIYAQRKAILEWIDAGRPIDLFLTMHNTDVRDAERIEGALSVLGPPFKRLATRLMEVLVDTSNFYGPQPPRDTAPELMNVYLWLVREKKVPALLLEHAVDFDPRLGRSATPKDRMDSGAALVRAMCTVVEESAR